MAKKKSKQRRVENRFIVIETPKDKKDEEGQKRLTEARRALEAEGFRVVRSAGLRDEGGRAYDVQTGKLPSEKNYILVGERPLS